MLDDNCTKKDFRSRTFRSRWMTSAIRNIQEWMNDVLCIPFRYNALVEIISEARTEVFHRPLIPHLALARLQYEYYQLLVIRDIILDNETRINSIARTQFCFLKEEEKGKKICYINLDTTLQSTTIVRLSPHQSAIPMDGYDVLGASIQKLYSRVNHLNA